MSIYLFAIRPAIISSSITASLSASNSSSLSLSIPTSILLSSLYPIATVGSSLSPTSISSYSHALIIMHPSIPYSITLTHPPTTIILSISIAVHPNGSIKIVSYLILVSTLKIVQNSPQNLNSYSILVICPESHLYYF